MAYEKQNFTDGQILNAAHLSHIEEGIVAVENAVGGIIDDTIVGAQAWSGKNAVNTLGIVAQTFGSAIAVSDSSGLPLQGLRLFGKTKQDGTPTPESPAELVSIGDNGSIAVKVIGKNLWDEEWELGTITTGDINRTATNTIRSTNYIPVKGGVPLRLTSPQMMRVLVYDANKKLLYVVYPSVGGSHTPTQDGYIRFAIGGAVGSLPAITSYHNDICISVCSDSASGTYERYKEPQTFTIATPNGLRGIPVSEGGNYTDENAQQWICDEIDFARGVYVQRIGIIDGYAGEEITGAFLSTTGELTEGGKVLYALDTPVETDISQEELAQYAVLHAHKPNTTVISDSWVSMAVEYVADTKCYIDNKFAELQSAILATGANI